MEANASEWIEANRKLQEENQSLREENEQLWMLVRKLEPQQEENRLLREENEQLWTLVRALEPLQRQVETFEQRIKELENREKEQGEKIEALEEKTQLDSHNSSLPPSSDGFNKPQRSLREKSGKKPGGQEGHAGRTLCQVREPDEVLVQAVQRCEHCLADLQTDPVLGYERRQEWDIPPQRLIVREYQAQQKWCPHCQQITQATFPDQITAPVQYGPALGAVGVYLVEHQLLPYERASEVMEDLLGIDMSVGTLKNLIDKCANNLAAVEESIKEHLRKVQVRHQDETGCSVKGKGWWMHVASTQAVTHYAVHPKRGCEALEAIGLMEGFTGTSVHDDLASYRCYTACTHGSCNVHHLRELKYQEEQKKQVWAKLLAQLLLEMKREVEQAKAAGQSNLTEEVLKSLIQRYEDLLRTGYAANPPDPPPQRPKKGRVKQSKARNLLDRLSNQEDVLRFLHDFSVPFDNNLAERDLRMVKVQQKVSGCFRSEQGAHAFARIRGYLSTLRKQALPVLSALEMALVGHPLLPAL